MLGSPRGKRATEDHCRRGSRTARRRSSYRATDVGARGTELVFGADDSGHGGGHVLLTALQQVVDTTTSRAAIKGIPHSPNTIGSSVSASSTTP